jgi:hypothetical protein
MPTKRKPAMGRDGRTGGNDATQTSGTVRNRVAKADTPPGEAFQSNIARPAGRATWQK